MTGVSSHPTEANHSTIRDAFDAWKEGTAPITDVFAPGMVSRMEAAPWRRGSTVHADGDTVIVLWDGRGIANDGLPYENSYAWFMRMRNGKVVDGTAFYDSIPFNDLWTRVPPG